MFAVAVLIFGLNISVEGVVWFVVVVGGVVVEVVVGFEVFVDFEVVGFAVFWLVVLFVGFWVLVEVGVADVTKLEGSFRMLIFDDKLEAITHIFPKYVVPEIFCMAFLITFFKDRLAKSRSVFAISINKRKLTILLLIL